MNDGGGGSYPPGMDTGRGRGRGVNTTAGRGGQFSKYTAGALPATVERLPGIPGLVTVDYSRVYRDCQ